IVDSRAAPYTVIHPRIGIDTNFSRAKRNMVVNHPFYASFLMSRLEEVFIQSDDEMFHYGATDGKKLYINWENVNALTYDQIISFMIHEILHVIYMHHIFMKGREPRLWNIATDYRINWDITHEGL